MDIGAVVLHKLLKEQSLDGWARVRLAYFPPAYSSIFAAINKYYNTYSEIANFEQLLAVSRDPLLIKNLEALQTLDVPEIAIGIAIDALIDQYAQDETINYLDKFIDRLPILDVHEIKDSLSEIVLGLDEKTMTSEKVAMAGDMNIFEKVEDSEHARFPLGINNTFDGVLGGAYREELILIGGKRGAGKSVVCSNIVCAQYDQGNTALYFTIEMRASEIFQRNCAILAGVPHVSLRQNNLSKDEINKLAKVRAGMFLEGEEVFNDFLQHGDRFLFEQKLKQKPVKPDNQIVIVDDRDLSITTIDLHIQKFKAMFKDKLTVVIVDYLNQVSFPGNKDSMYDWKVQIELSKQLKNLARKYDVCMISPMQIDDDNGIRYAKGILDAPDIAFILDAHSKEDNCITFDTTKIRGGPPISFTSAMDWNSLRISPVDIPPPAKKLKEKAKGDPKLGDLKGKVNDDASDVPW